MMRGVKGVRRRRPTIARESAMTNEPSKALNPDWGKAAADYAAHRAGLPQSFFARLEAIGVLRAGKRVVDLGTGTGSIARELAIRGLGRDRSGRVGADARAGTSHGSQAGPERTLR